MAPAAARDAPGALAFEGGVMKKDLVWVSSFALASACAVDVGTESTSAPLRVCEASECTGAAAEAAYDCADGTRSEATGRCVEGEAPGCYWETIGCGDEGGGSSEGGDEGGGSGEGDGGGSSEGGDTGGSGEGDGGGSSEGGDTGGGGTGEGDGGSSEGGDTGGSGEGDGGGSSEGGDTGGGTGEGDGSGEGGSGEGGDSGGGGADDGSSGGG
jgi:hypothetical protein